MQLSMPASLLKALPIVLPLCAIAFARLLTFSEWAQANSGWAALVFAWIVLDALGLGLLAKARDNRPAVRQVIGVLALGSMVILLGASAAVREVIFGLPEALVAMALTIAAFLVWNCLIVIRSYLSNRSMRKAAEQVMPPLLVKFAITESRMLSLALFRWGAPADIPAGTQGFAYHTYLTPMLVTFIALQLIELSVVHFLLMLWNPTVAMVLLALSIWGVIWMIALIKSFRINPVLLSNNHVRARSGTIYDVTIPRSLIADHKRSFSSEELQQKDVLNFAILSSPNVCLRLERPIMIPTFLGGEKPITGVALRLDESAAFLAELERTS